MVGDQDADAARLEEADDLLDVDHGDRIDAGKRLVQQDETRARRERARDLDAAALASGQRKRRSIGEMRDRQVLEQSVEAVR